MDSYPPFVIRSGRGRRSDNARVTVPTWLAVALGGALGALLRWGVSQWLPARPDGGLPWATLTVNVAGSLILALVVVASLSGRFGPGWAATGVATGFCGALTTFSTFSFETVTLARGGHYGVALAYVGLNLLLCMAIVALVLRALPRG